MTNEKVLAALKRYMYVSEEGSPDNMSGKNEIAIDCVETEQTKDGLKEETK